MPLMTQSKIENNEFHSMAMNDVKNGILSISDSFYSISFLIVLNAVKFNLFAGYDGVLILVVVFVSFCMTTVVLPMLLFHIICCVLCLRVAGIQFWLVGDDDGDDDYAICIRKILWQHKNSETFTIFSGGLSTERDGKSQCITVLQGRSTTVLEMEHPVVDFITICESPWSSGKQFCTLLLL